jgi:hypothetical protein
MVDASVNVIDVFADFPKDADGNGVIDWTSSSERPDKVREWRTVLLGAAGEGGSELFALDVTNPLAPVLLWHLTAAQEKDGRFDVDGDGDWDVFDPADPKTYALKWFDWDDGSAVTDHIPTDYHTADTGILAKLKSGGYDYRNLGLTYGTAIGKISVGDAFHYVAYVATSMVDFTDASSPSTSSRGASSGSGSAPTRARTARGTPSPTTPSPAASRSPTSTPTAAWIASTWAISRGTSGSSTSATGET